VSVSRAGYVTAAALSAVSAPVATDRAPSVALTAGRTGLRREQSTTLTWVLKDATTAQASGNWSGTEPTQGSVRVRPTTLGPHDYRLTATNANGTTTTQVTIGVTRQATRLTVDSSAGILLAGSRVRVTGLGLDAGEAYAIALDGTRLALGRATSTGSVARTVTVPASTHQGVHRITLIGSEPDRKGSAVASVVTKTGMRMHLAKQKVRASDPQTVTVTGLAAGEPVTITYQGKRVSPRGAHATAAGRYSATFKVDTVWGTKTVKAVGAYSLRRTTGTFQVVRRCRVGHVCD
jgi:hypothetical protein